MAPFPRTRAGERGPFCVYQKGFLLALPQILASPGLKLIEIGEDDRGAFLKFASTRNRVRMVTVYMMADGPIRWAYAYASYDPSTRTVVSYEGKHGDPEKDKRINMKGTTS